MSDLLDSIRGVTNACQPFPNLLTGGQPGAAQFEAFRAAGGRVVLDLRAPREPRMLDQPATLARLGLEYIVVPIGPTPLSDQLLEQVLDALRAHPDEPVLVHCATGNRVGGALIPYFMLERGLDENTALELAQEVGLQSPQLAQWGLDYARRHVGE